MESLGVFADAEWESFSKIFSTEDQYYDDHQIDLTSQYFDQCTFPDLHNLFQDSSYGSSDYSGNVFLPSQTHQTAYFFSDSTNHIIPSTNDTSSDSMSMDISVMAEKKLGLQAFPDFLTKETSPINGDMSGVFQAKELQLKRKLDSSQNTKLKRPRVSRDVEMQVQKTKKKRNLMSPLKANEGDEEISINGSTGSDGQSSSSYSSLEDIENASQETTTNGGEGGATASDSKDSVALNINGKPRATRGAATDPQSLYARKRRERINERLKMLQNLVPNGTKVDISTMLEEAVHYVKFMQLQIKLLSSDDLWMYAPIAYNGFDVCLNQKISPFL